MKRKKMRGLSPVVATVLLIVIVIAIALIVFLWIRGMVEEPVTKFGGENIQLACDTVAFEAGYSDNTLYVSNIGTTPIFGMNVKEMGEGSYKTENLRDKSSLWPETGLNQGGVFSDVLSFDGDEIIVIPILLGESDSGRKTYVCEEQYGQTILI
jgi:flagellin-like protein